MSDYKRPRKIRVAVFAPTEVSECWTGYTRYVNESWTGFRGWFEVEASSWRDAVRKAIALAKDAEPAPEQPEGGEG